MALHRSRATVGEDRDGFVDLGVGDEQRRREPQRAVGDRVDDEARVEAPLRDVLGVDARRELGGEQQARAPRTSTTPGDLLQRRRRAARRRASARAGTSSRSMTSSTASAARAASGWPPNVVAWSPGRNAAATSARAQHAPIGTPLPSALAIVDDVGPDAGVLEPEPPAGAPEPGLHLVDDQQRFALVAQPRARAARYSARRGFTPPSPCTASSMTARDAVVDRGGERVEVVERDLPEPVGQRLERLLLLRLAGRRERRERAAVERAVRARSRGSGRGPPLRWPYRRASLIAHSFASAPELAKNTRPSAAEQRVERAPRAGVGRRCSRGSTRAAACAAWSAIASATSGCAWPSDVTASPPGSRDSALPSLSQSSGALAAHERDRQPAVGLHHVLGVERVDVRRSERQCSSFMGAPSFRHLPG